MSPRGLLLCFVIAIAVAGCGRANRDKRVRLATTTSTDSSGLLEHLLPVFHQRTGFEAQVIAVGTGQALELGRRGDVDVVLVHARKLENAFVAKGYGVDRRDVMWNDFVLLGPPADPAGIRGLKDAVEALRRIRAGKHRFLSRSDNSGTHIRELELWAQTGGAPKGHNFYLEAGQGMGKCLVIADQKRAYLLADRGTYLAFARKLELDIHVEGDPRLRNPYGMILVNPKKHPHVRAKAARALLDYFTSADGQRRIGAFRVDGKVLFHPVAGK